LVPVFNPAGREPQVTHTYVPGEDKRTSPRTRHVCVPYGRVTWVLTALEGLTDTSMEQPPLP